jgi:hypothetical protein
MPTHGDGGALLCQVGTWFIYRIAGTGVVATSNVDFTKFQHTYLIVYVL